MLTGTAVVPAAAGATAATRNAEASAATSHLITLLLSQGGWFYAVRHLVTSATICQRSPRALREQGFRDAAHEAFKEAVRSRSREATIRHHALFERSQNYEQQGKKAMARKDLERILGEDSTYPGVREQLAALAP
jgi:tetratricopeptide (TPR) repeat protein